MGKLAAPWGSRSRKSREGRSTTKVLHLIKTLYAGGAEIHLLTLCRGLRERAVDVTVATLCRRIPAGEPIEERFEDLGVPVIHLQEHPGLSLAASCALARLLLLEQPTLLHTHLPRADVVGALAGALAPGLRRISSIHDIYSVHWAGRRALPLLDRVWRRADRLIAASEAVRDWLAVDRRIPRERIDVVRYGIEAARFARPSRDLRREWGLDKGIVIGSAARLEPRKGHEDLIRAIPAILAAFPGAVLLIAGHDLEGYRPTLERLIGSLSLQEHVRLVGFQRDIVSFLYALDLFVFASRSEGFGQIVIEAMASGRPVVAARAGAIRELVVEGETGLLVDLASPAAIAGAVISLLGQPSRMRTMGLRGVDRVRRRFDAARMTAEILDVYNDVACLSRRGSP